MTSLGSRAAPDCRTGQSKSRYRARTRALQSYSLVYFFLEQTYQNYQYHHFDGLLLSSEYNFPNKSKREEDFEIY
jgi:hypothetical protein